MPVSKIRLDKLLVERGLAPSRERAQAVLLAGRVLVDGQKQTKAGLMVASESVLRLLGHDMPFVSRGGLKLAHALTQWRISLADRDCLDVGASTGGFTDCMLQAGARSVLAVDTGWGQIAEKLRADGRVQLRERTNARLLGPGSLGPGSSGTGSSGLGPTFLAMDVSFISAALVLPPVLLAAPGVREAVVLVKPQFEAGREWVGKGGIARAPEAHALAQEKVRAAALNCGARSVELTESPITGAEGNREFLLHASFPRNCRPDK